MSASNTNMDLSRENLPSVGTVPFSGNSSDLALNLDPAYPAYPAYPGNTRVDLILRLIIGPICMILYLVPLRVLHRNGEFAAFIFVSSLFLSAFFFTIDAAIWHSHDTTTWWNGVGYCDVHVQVVPVLPGVACASIFALMKNLSISIAQIRTGPMRGKERRRNALRQSLIIFPVPILQSILLYLGAVNRYDIMPLVGCQRQYDQSWPVIVALLPPPIFALAGCILAAIIYIHYRRFQRSNSPNQYLLSNPLIRQQANRARRRLYLLSITILVPYFPLVTAFYIRNVQLFLPLVPYSFKRVHSGTEVAGISAEWGNVYYFAGPRASSQTIFSTWIPEMAVVPVFVFFGLTTEAINCYRRVLLKLGFGRIWPVLTNKYSPNRTMTRRSWMGSVLRSRSMGNNDSSSSSNNNTGNIRILSTDSSSSDDADKPIGILGPIHNLHSAPVSSSMPIPQDPGAPPPIRATAPEKTTDAEAQNAIGEIWDGTQEVVIVEGERPEAVITRAPGDRGVSTNCWSGSAFGVGRGPEYRQVTVETEIERRTTSEE